ncbi:isoleucine--tRNA ligase [Tsukamurella sp. PLM1]|nr:isoleucine--tRNA ligase [Tsukamurella sp. PLM1]
MSEKRPYPLVDMTRDDDGPARTGAPSFPDLEERVLAYWAEHDTFRKSIANRDGAGSGASGPSGDRDEEFVFYDGPPFANGLPHYGHLLTGYVKDLVPRFQTMRGKKVDRRFGWDTHGLPAELEAERQLGIKDKSEIETMGVEKFNDYCRTSVLRYTEEWRQYVTRQARWVDFDNDYKTLDLDFMESVMWAFKTLHEKGLIYQGYRVLPYSWYEQTPLSNQESKLDDAYKMRQDPAVTVGMPLRTKGTKLEELDGVEALIWTTTPWTLPSNLAIAVHPDLDYVVVTGLDGKDYLLADARLGQYARELGESPEVKGTYKGRDLEFVAYEPPFDFFAGHPKAHVTLLADYVTTDSGTGVVHLAPAFGEEDMDLATGKYGIEVVQPLDAGGKFTSAVPPYEGLQVFDANPVITKDLKAKGRLLRHETIEHSYPHSWRSGQPLIYMAVPSWFVEVTKIIPRMLELNQDITWSPAHLRDGQFGKWVEGARDWNISRNRYWGAPIPVWVSDDPAYPRVDVYGSLDELERDFGVRPTNLHRPYIDELTRPNPDDPTGKSTMRRVPEVLDCWFESGSMPFAQVHYPFENQEWFDTHFPGDFIVEYNGQTKGWFYNLHVLATALFDSAAFRTVAAHGIVLGHDGLKMSKSKRNYPDVNEVFNRDGSDAMRWFLMASPILRGGNLVVTEQGIRDGVRQTLLPLWNAYSFLQLYAEQPATWRTDSQDVLDRYILAKLAQTRDTMTEALETYNVADACEELRLFVDALTNWYVRRSRARFWDGSDQGCFDTLYTVLETACRLAAPLLPMATEAMWRGLTGGVGAPDGLALGDRPPGGSGPGRGDGRGPRRLLCGLLGAQGEQAARAAAAAHAHRRRPRRGETGAVRVDHRRRGERARRAGLARRRSVRPGRDRGQRSRRRSAPGQGRPDGDQGREVRRLHRRRRRGDRRGHRAPGRRVHPQAGGRSARLHRGAARRCRARRARPHGGCGTGGRGLGQGPHPRAAGGAPRGGARRERPDRAGAGCARRARRRRADAPRAHRERGARDLSRVRLARRRRRRRGSG